MYRTLDPDDYNVRILTGTVREAVQGTICSVGLRDRVIEPDDNEIDSGKNINGRRSSRLPSRSAAGRPEAAAVIAVMLGAALFLTRVS